jgi:hypothetical protein
VVEIAAAEFVRLPGTLIFGILALASVTVQMPSQFARMLTKADRPRQFPCLPAAPDWETLVKAQIKVFPLKHLIAMDAHGTLDLAASIAALKLLAAAPGFEDSSEVLLDLRDVECEMSTTNIFELAEFMALASTGLAAGRRIAVLVGAHRRGHLAFNKAQFLELCADNRGLNVRAFEDPERADEWLNAANEIFGKTGAPISIPMHRFFASVMEAPAA